jgi:hypothetical protein
MIKILLCSTSSSKKEYRNAVNDFEKEVLKRSFNNINSLETFIENFFGAVPVYLNFSPSSLYDTFKMLTKTSNNYKCYIDYFIPNKGDLRIETIVKKKILYYN